MYKLPYSTMILNPIREYVRMISVEFHKLISPRIPAPFIFYTPNICNSYMPSHAENVVLMRHLVKENLKQEFKVSGLRSVVNVHLL